MRIGFLTYFLTLVVSVANAAPETSIKPSPLQTKDTPISVTKDPENETVRISPAPPAPRSERILRSEQVSDASMNFGVGAAQGAFEKDHEQKNLTTFHFQRTQYNLDESAQEFGLFLLTNNDIGVDWGFKKFFGFTTVAAPWDPYYKLGVTGIYIPKDQLANFIDLQKYFGQLSVGFESFLLSHHSLRWELGIRAGYPGTHVFTQILYAFPD